MVGICEGPQLYHGPCGPQMYKALCADSRVAESLEAERETYIIKFPCC